MKVFFNLILVSIFIPSLIIAKEEQKKTDVDFKIIPERTSYMPGDTIRTAVPFNIEEEWHIYWENPGDAGIPSSIEFDLPKGVELISTEWPAPAILKYSIFANFIFESRVTVRYSFLIGRDYKGGNFLIKGNGKWLVCKEKCIPGKGRDSTIIVIGKNSSDNPDYQKAFDSLPYKFPEDDGINIELDNIKNHELVLTISNPETEISKAYFFPRSDDLFAHAAEQITEKLGSKYIHRIKFEKHIKKYPESISGIFGFVTENGKRLYYNVDVKYKQEKQ